MEFLRENTQSCEHGDAAMLDLSFTEEVRMPLGASRIAPQVVAEPGRIEDANWAADACGHVCGHGPGTRLVARMT